MSRKEDEARLQGMDYAYRQIQKIGLEEFRKELKWRSAHGISLCVSPKAIDEASTVIKSTTIDTIFLLSVATLRDEFDFGAERIKRFMTRFDQKTGGLAKGFVTWDDYREQLQKELGFELKLGTRLDTMTGEIKTGRRSKHESA